MSASTEKKNRQAARAAGTDKKTLAAQEEAKKRAKSRRNWTLGTIGVVLLIALIGLLAYLRDEVNRRRRELAIRTIFGASASTLLKLFLRRLLYILLPSLLLGLLLSYIVSERILQLFATRISLSVWLLGGMALAVGLLACLFSGYLVLKAIRLNPRENLTAE